MRIRTRKAKYWGHRAGTESAGVPHQVPLTSDAPTQAARSRTRAPPGWVGSGEGHTHQPQQAADLIDGTNAAQEAHEHGEGPYADEDVGSHLERGGGGLCGVEKSIQVSLPILPLFYFILFYFLGPPLRHMEVPRLGVKSEL